MRPSDIHQDDKRAAGVLFYNNTILTETAADLSERALRNNLMLERPTCDFQRQYNTNYSSFGLATAFASTPSRVFIPMEPPPFDVPADYSGMVGGTTLGGNLL